MIICGQWFDESNRARIAETVQQVPDLFRRALAKRVCEWLGWQDARGQPQLGGVRKALAGHDRRGVSQATVVCDLKRLGEINVELVETAELVSLFLRRIT